MRTDGGMNAMPTTHRTLQPLLLPPLPLLPPLYLQAPLARPAQRAMSTLSVSSLYGTPTVTQFEGWKCLRSSHGKGQAISHPFCKTFSNITSSNPRRCSQRLLVAHSPRPSPQSRHNPRSCCRRTHALTAHPLRPRTGDTPSLMGVTGKASPPCPSCTTPLLGGARGGVPLLPSSTPSRNRQSPPFVQRLNLSSSLPGTLSRPHHRHPPWSRLSTGTSSSCASSNSSNSNSKQRGWCSTSRRRSSSRHLHHRSTLETQATRALWFSKWWFPGTTTSGPSRPVAAQPSTVTRLSQCPRPSNPPNRSTTSGSTASPRNSSLCPQRSSSSSSSSTM
eukprot:Sspe_Gene.75158::Locus_46967_Transcript_1_1_Confidence_1.000_Length_1121::g.75158::m.75158